MGNSQILLLDSARSFLPKKNDKLLLIMIVCILALTCIVVLNLTSYNLRSYTIKAPMISATHKLPSIGVVLYSRSFYVGNCKAVEDSWPQCAVARGLHVV